MFGGLEAGWAYAPMPPAASAAVPRSALHSSSRRVTPDCHRIAVSFVQRRLPPYQRISLSAITLTTASGVSSVLKRGSLGVHPALEWGRADGSRFGPNGPVQ